MAGWGGTPFNQISALCESHEKWAIVTGLNLPMLIEALNSRDEGLDPEALAKRCIETSHEGIRHINELLAQA